jgi:hypothetical protein
MKTIHLAPQIVLTPAELQSADRRQPAILSLGSALAAASVEWHAPVYWVSRHDPARVLGALLEEFHGIYPSAAGLLCVQLGGDREHFLLPQPSETWEPADFERLLARVLQRHIAGQSYSAIVTEIHAHAAHRREREAA